MKATLLLFLFTLGMTFKVRGQAATARMRVLIRDTSSRSVFDVHPQLRHFIVRFDKGEANKVQAIYQKSADRTSDIETYSMSFEGDRYALFKKYPGLKIPQEPKLEVASLHKIQNLADSNVHVEVTAYLRRDTIDYDFSHFILKKGVYWYNFTDAYSPPKFWEERQIFEKKLNVAYQRWKPVAAIDSTLVITAIVEPGGSMHDARLLLGESSDFSNKVLDFIGREAKTWLPAKAIRTKRIRSQAKIFVRLNKDDTITFSTL